LLGGGAALLLVGLLALMRFMRKPKPFAAPGDAPADEEFHAVDEEEQRLLDTLQHDPANSAASLELLRHYYAQGDAARFEATAEQMHAHLMDPSTPEWDEVLAMGAVLVPTNPLFGDAAAPSHAIDEAHLHAARDEFAYAEPTHIPAAFDEGAHSDTTVHAEPDETFEYDLPRHVDVAHSDAAHADAATTLHDASLPDLTFEPAPHGDEHPVQHDLHVTHAEQHEEPVAAPRSEELFVGEDAIGTKLDLAKAYLDMGDPEGARSMLDEVMAEGDHTQQDEARKLLAEIK